MCTYSKLRQCVAFIWEKKSGFSEIVLSLHHIDGITLSLSTLRRDLKTSPLFRKKVHPDLLDVAMSLQDQLDRSTAETCRLDVLVGFQSISITQKKKN